MPAIKRTHIHAHTESINKKAVPKQQQQQQSDCNLTFSEGVQSQSQSQSESERKCNQYANASICQLLLLEIVVACLFVAIICRLIDKPQAKARHANWQELDELHSGSNT